MLVLKAHVFVLEDVELVMDLLEIRSLKMKVMIRFLFESDLPIGQHLRSE